MRRLALLVVVCCTLVAPAFAQEEQLPERGRLTAPELLYEAEQPPYPWYRPPSSYEGCQPDRDPVSQPNIEPRGLDPASPDPLLGARLFVDPEEPAYRSWRFQ